MLSWPTLGHHNQIDGWPAALKSRCSLLAVMGRIDLGKVADGVRNRLKFRDRKMAQQQYAYRPFPV